MIFDPGVLALLSGSFLVVATLLYASWYGIRILRRWDLCSGSQLQLSLERRTYLIATIMAYALGFQLLSLFLFISTADRLSSLLAGAMCAAGALNANKWGYPALILKIVNFMAAGVWLIINATDNSAYDYPLIKKKYMLLVPITALICVEAAFQTMYFLRLKPDIITSCCGALFSAASSGAVRVAVLPRKPVAASFYFCMALTLTTGLFSYTKGKGAYLFSLSSSVLFGVSILALINYISPYFYELPTHHCPFCILHGEYNFVGYPIYLALLTGGTTGLGIGAISPFSGVKSLQQTIPKFRKELILICLSSWLALFAISAWGILFSNLRMD
ncbi:MAG: hypothetical protein P4L55_23600 [Syntrophobacteraceae bacterium]|nr:hypothetical protein [Syntrophobacteraceae bacterium]